MASSKGRRFAAVVAAVVLVFGLAACQASPTPDVGVGEWQATVAPRPTPSATTTSPMPTLPPAPPAVAPTLMARPLSLSVPRIGVEATVEEYTNAMVIANGGAVDPVRMDTVSWWSGGSAPGADATNTVYMYGHTWINPAVFNDLKDLQAGDEILVTTEKGVLRYIVERSYQVAKTGLTANADYTEAKAGRLLLVACYRETGEERVTRDNLVVQAQLAPFQP